MRRKASRRCRRAKLVDELDAVARNRCHLQEKRHVDFEKGVGVSNRCVRHRTTALTRQVPSSLFGPHLPRRDGELRPIGALLLLLSLVLALPPANERLSHREEVPGKPLDVAKSMSPADGRSGSLARRALVEGGVEHEADYMDGADEVLVEGWVVRSTRERVLVLGRWGEDGAEERQR